MSTDSADRLDILHVMRAPVGGLFRHVVDLVRGQAAQGHRVGLIADASTGGARAEAALAELAPALALGLTRVAMSRQLGPQDIAACRHVSRRAAEVAAHVVHGHGAKGGAYARLAQAPQDQQAPHAIRVYTPHGGSLHYAWGTPAGFLYLAAERLLMRRTDLFLFESAYGLDVFRRKVGDPGGRARVVHNGVADSEFAPVAPAADATDLLLVGELRLLKGVDVLIAAVTRLAAEGRPVTVTVVGDGPDRARFEAAARGHAVRFVGAMPARAAFARGRVLVVPSRAESLPYIVLEAAAAAVPLIATRVGGIPEIYGPDADRLIPPDDPVALALAIRAALERAQPEVTARLQARIRSAFSVAIMTQAVLAGYRDALAQHG
jgi:glycosyltransferase involved in cell wall biosynthesis